MLVWRRSLIAILVLCVLAGGFLIPRRNHVAADATKPAAKPSLSNVAPAPPTAAVSVSAIRPAANPARASAPFRDFAAAPAPRTTGAYGDLPLAFEKNEGQTDARAKYLARGKGYTLFLTPEEAVLSLRYPQPTQSDDVNASTPLSPAAAAAQRLASHDPVARARSTKWSQSVLSLEFASARPRAQKHVPRIEAIEQLPTISNYYIGNDPAQWHAGIPNFRKVVYRDAYRGVDVAYYGNPTQLETDFVVKPGANPRSIRLRAKGANAIRASGDGGLVLTTAAGDVRLHKPVVYQESAGERHEIAGNYRLCGTDRIEFSVAPYDHTQPLIIDPTLTFSTYLGGSTNDEGLGIAVDASGEAYVTGFTQSSDFPTASASQGALPGQENAYVTKFAANGTSLVFSTFLGGSSTDQGDAIAVDSSGSAYVVGETRSNNFPLKLPLVNQGAFSGIACAFVSEFSSTGTLTFSTYLCGGTADEARGVTVDTNKNIYVTGATESANFPAVNPIQGSLAGTVNSFVTKLAAVTAGGSSIIFSSYFGGNRIDQGLGIALDGANPPHIFIAGSSDSTQFPTVNAFQPNNGGATGGQNGFIAEFNVPPVGAGAPSTLYATFIGGSQADDCTGIAVDAAGNAYVVGTVQSPDFPLKNSLQALDQAGDAFVAKVAAGGGANSLDFSTAFGGGGEFSSGIALDNSANPPNIYFTGRTDSSLFPTRIPFQAVFANAGDNGGAFVSELKNDGSDYIFSTYLQGSSPLSFIGDEGNAIAVDSTGNVYVAGDTGTLDFPTVTPFDGTIKVFGSDTNAFVSKISPATPAGDQVFPASLNFGDVVMNASAFPQIITLVAGSTDSTISNVTLTGADAGDFAEFSTCGADVPTTVVCNFTISFTPSALGPRNAVLTVTEPSVTHTINITGTGSNTPAAPPNGTLTFNNTPLVFGSQEVNTDSAVQNFSVSVTGTVPVTLTTNIGNIGANPNDFFATSGSTAPCPLFSPIQPGTNCNLGVIFRPSATGARSATVQVSGNFTGAPLAVPVSGTAVPEIGILNPTFLTFAAQLINTASASQPITLTNMGGGPSLTVQTITFSGPFSGTGSCFGAAAPVVLTNGQSCTINVTFTPTVAGSIFGSVTVQDTDPQNPTQSASFSGTGLNGAATLFVQSPFTPNLSFGRAPVGSAAQNPPGASIENIGNDGLNVATSITGPNAADFQVTTPCSGTVAAAQTCFIQLSFTPAAAGPAFATLTISGMDAATGGVAINSPKAIALSGQGVAPTTSKLLPNPVVFPNTPLNTTSAPVSVFLSNTGTSVDFITSVTITPATQTAFQQSDTTLFGQGCNTGGSLNAQGTCVVSLTFTPNTAGTTTAMLVVTDSATGTPQQVLLTGGTGASPPVVQLAPTSINFGANVQNQQSIQRTATVTNTGASPLNITAIAATGDFLCFAQGTQTCALPNQQTANPPCTTLTPLAPLASCDIGVTFTPTATGTRNGTLSITDNAAGSPQSVTLTGTGVSGQLTVTPAMINFPVQIVNTTSASMPVTVSNGTTFNQSVLLPIVTPAGFAETDNCTSNGAPVPIPPNGTCTINVTFTPTSATQFQGNLQLSIEQGLGSPPPAPFTVALTGTGTNATFSLSFASGATGTVSTNPGGTAAVGILVTGTQGIAQTVNLSATTTSNTINTSVTPSSIKLTGSGNQQVAAVLQTACRGAVSIPGAPKSTPPWAGLGALLAALLVATMAFTYRRQPRWAIALALLLLIGIGGAACGGDPGANGPTPPGTYPVTLTATSGQQVQTLNITLIVN